MQDLSIPTPKKNAQLILVKRIPYTDENIKFFQEAELEEVTQTLINEGFDPLDLNDGPGLFQVPLKLVEILNQRYEWEAEGHCTKCGEYMKTDNSGDEHNRADFAYCSNGCL